MCRQMQQQIAMMQAQLGGQVPGAQLPMAQAQVGSDQELPVSWII